MIGLFDSGLGGLSVWRELVRQFPAESTLYLADRAYCPYGGRTADDILARSDAIVHYLLEQGATLILIACNTATSAAARSLRLRHPQLPIVAMEPAVKPAAQHSQSGRIAVLATRATLAGDKFHDLKAQYDSDVTILPVPGDGFVELVEAGELDGERARTVVRQALAPLEGSGVDQVVLGCTHYPFLAPLVEAALPPGVRLIDPAPAVCRQVGRLLQRHGLSAPADATARHRFVTTADAPGMEAFLHGVLGRDEHAHTVTLEKHA